MGTCKYCGKSAGIFFKSHKECETKHKDGMQTLTFIVGDFLSRNTTASTLANTLSRLRIDNFLSEEDICEACDKCIRNYSAGLHRPISKSSMQIVDELINAVGVDYSKIHSWGGIKEFAQKLMRSHLTEYFTNTLDLQRAKTRCQTILQTFPLTPDEMEDAYLQVLDKAVGHFMKNGTISSNDQKIVDDYVNAFALQINNLPTKYQNSELGKLGQASLLAKLQNGIIPNTGISAPIVLGRGEAIICAYPGVNLYQEKVTREYVGRTGGFNIRIMKGVHYRTGQFKGHPVEKSSMEHQGVGTLYVTNKNLIFHSQTKSVKVPYQKLIGLSPYSDGVEVNRDGANVKRMTLQGFDPCFLMNALPYLV